MIEEKSFRFAIRIVRLYHWLLAEKKKYVLSKQLMRSGTGIGSNVAEAEQAQSKADFISKNSIALKEATETDYWLRLLHATDYLTAPQYRSMIKDCRELERLLISIIKTAKQSTDTDRGADNGQ